MYTLVKDDSIELSAQLRSEVVAFNNTHFNAERIPLGFKIIEKTDLVAGISGHVFGNWLLISWLWCDEGVRGCGFAKQLLNELELAAVEHGAIVAQLDTLDFQAKPFYEKNGYIYPNHLKMQNSAFHRGLISRRYFARMAIPFKEEQR